MPTISLRTRSILAASASFVVAWLAGPVRDAHA
jgi:hypothetical protein